MAKVISGTIGIINDLEISEIQWVDLKTANELMLTIQKELKDCSVLQRHTIFKYRPRRREMQWIFLLY